ncbi:unnamed protein product [Caenorhabditis auriculariae]|uniref:Uncharacterized protein n=1 Tax=Caenorhabditis auriculariae TaxID=2777116 RepID=A0A8S1HPT2_9PELO|nr:unnamed protein product [Caenorhabditis auriculariae]
MSIASDTSHRRQDPLKLALNTLRKENFDLSATRICTVEVFAGLKDRGDFKDVWNVIWGASCDHKSLFDVANSYYKKFDDISLLRTVLSLLPLVDYVGLPRANRFFSEVRRFTWIDRLHGGKWEKELRHFAYAAAKSCCTENTAIFFVSWLRPKVLEGNREKTCFLFEIYVRFIHYIRTFRIYSEKAQCFLSQQTDACAASLIERLNDFIHVFPKDAPRNSTDYSTFAMGCVLSTGQILMERTSKAETVNRIFDLFKDLLSRVGRLPDKIVDVDIALCCLRVLLYSYELIISQKPLGSATDLTDYSNLLKPFLPYSWHSEGFGGGPKDVECGLVAAELFSKAISFHRERIIERGDVVADDRVLWAAVQDLLQPRHAWRNDRCAVFVANCSVHLPVEILLHPQYSPFKIDLIDALMKHLCDTNFATRHCTITRCFSFYSQLLSRIVSKRDLDKYKESVRRIISLCFEEQCRLEEYLGKGLVRIMDNEDYCHMIFSTIRRAMNGAPEKVNYFLKVFGTISHSITETLFCSNLRVIRENLVSAKKCIAYNSNDCQFYLLIMLTILKRNSKFLRHARFNIVFNMCVSVICWASDETVRSESVEETVLEIVHEMISLYSELIKTRFKSGELFERRSWVKGILRSASLNQRNTAALEPFIDDPTVLKSFFQCCSLVELKLLLDAVDVSQRLEVKKAFFEAATYSIICGVFIVSRVAFDEKEAIAVARSEFLQILFNCWPDEPCALEKKVDHNADWVIASRCFRIDTLQLTSLHVLRDYLQMTVFGQTIVNERLLFSLLSLNDSTMMNHLKELLPWVVNEYLRVKSTTQVFNLLVLLAESFSSIAYPRKILKNVFCEVFRKPDVKNRDVVDLFSNELFLSRIDGLSFLKEAFVHYLHLPAVSNCFDAMIEAEYMRRKQNLMELDCDIPSRQASEVDKQASEFIISFYEILSGFDEFCILRWLSIAVEMNFWSQSKIRLFEISISQLWERKECASRFLGFIRRHRFTDVIKKKAIRTFLSRRLEQMPERELIRAIETNTLNGFARDFFDLVSTVFRFSTIPSLEFNELFKIFFSVLDVLKSEAVGNSFINSFVNNFCFITSRYIIRHGASSLFRSCKAIWKICQKTTHVDSFIRWQVCEKVVCAALRSSEYWDCQRSFALYKFVMEITDYINTLDKKFVLMEELIWISPTNILLQMVPFDAYPCFFGVNASSGCSCAICKNPIFRKAWAGMRQPIILLCRKMQSSWSRQVGIRCDGLAAAVMAASLPMTISRIITGRISFPQWPGNISFTSQRCVAVHDAPTSFETDFVTSEKAQETYAAPEDESKLVFTEKLRMSFVEEAISFIEDAHQDNLEWPESTFEVLETETPDGNGSGRSSNARYLVLDILTNLRSRRNISDRLAIAVLNASVHIYHDCLRQGNPEEKNILPSASLKGLEAFSRWSETQLIEIPKETQEAVEEMLKNCSIYSFPFKVTKTR